jgi:hypothetical protein
MSSTAGTSAGLVTEAVQPLPEGGAARRPGVQADERGEAGQIPGYLSDQRREGALEDQAGAVEEIQELTVLGGLVAGIDRAAYGAVPRDAEHAAERHRVVG